jgi:FkbH-like protein
MNLELPRPLVRIDETAFKRQYGELALGRYFYDSDKYHPLVIAQKISVPYRNLILANKLLSSKKIVVIDLDDTVWKGTIGEGAVEHYIERQKILQELRRKGVLLAIVSKNDPRNVHWSGGVLAASDFVAEQINWNPKPSNIRRIASELNLKLKDFVFMDDRADQRELVKSSIAEIQVLDATAESSWDMLRWWAGSLPEQTETDRTQLYLERKQRESFLKVETEAFNQNMLFEVLELKIDFHIAARKELLRVAELINRTNQFNIRGSRASLKQVTARWESSKHRILVAEARDKFGEMGIISAMVLDLAEDALEISVWVLSCRVFGYGIETAMLNVVRRLGRRLNLAVIKGQILETPNNQPCREVYAANGFARQGDIWIGDTAAVSVDPSWLQITTHEDVNLPVVATRLQRQ